MKRVPDVVETIFHPFCMSCPLCEPAVEVMTDEHDAFGGNPVITCERYLFCKKFIDLCITGKIDLPPIESK